MVDPSLSLAVVGGNMVVRCYADTYTLEKDLGQIRVSDEELDFLRRKCVYFSDSYLEYLRNFRFRPKEQIKLEYTPTASPDALLDEEVVLP